jgi:replication factor A2
MMGMMDGGFIESSSTSKSAEKKNRDNQSLVPVTIKQLVSAPNNGESYRIDDADIYTVKLIGMVESIQLHSTFHLYQINDGTGSFECKFYVEKDSAAAAPKTFRLIMYLIFLFSSIMKDS